MKTRFLSFLAIAALVFNTLQADAKIRRVGYFANQISGQDYTSLQAAHDASTSGADTIYLFPGTWSATITKKITLIGYGYFVTASSTTSNPNLQAITGSLGVSVILASGSNGSSFLGLDGLSITPGGAIDVSDIVVRRCAVNMRYQDNIYTNWQVSQCYIYSWDHYFGSFTAKYINLLVENSFISNFRLNNTSPGGSTGIIKNCIFGYSSSVDFNNNAFAINSSIFLGTWAYNRDNCTFFNSISSANLIPSGNGNKPNETIANVCVGYPTQGNYSDDNRFELKAGSPAIGAGEGGIDCGIFGGPNPYRLSGIPAIPSFYKVSSSSTTTSGNPYTITFSVRSNN